MQKLEKFLQGKPIVEQEIGKQLLLETAAYAETAVCRRKVLLHYFGEEYFEENCGCCDNCLNPKTLIEDMANYLPRPVEVHAREAGREFVNTMSYEDFLGYL